MGRLHLPAAIFISALLISCEKEFTVTTEKQEAYAAYCLLNLKDSAHYVRVNRIFLTPDDPAQYFQEPDSVNIFAEDFEVTLQPFLEEEAEPLIQLFPSEDFPKDGGLFSTGHYKTFKTIQSLLPDRTYRLTIRNLVTGYEMTAETGLLGRRTIENTFKETRYYDINQYSPEIIDYPGDLNPGQWDKLILRFLYYEYAGTQASMKYVDYRYTLLKNRADVSDTSQHQLSDEFLKYLAQEIRVDTSLKRKAVGVDKMLVLNDEALAIYIEFSEDQSSGHYIPDLTNFDEGTGILASRYCYTYFALKLRKETIDTLALGRWTKQLRFADSNGNWPP
jgi:hypothetical protein